MNLVSIATVVACAGLAAAQQFSCPVNQGNPLAWLEVDLINYEVLEVSHAGHPMGDNFCYGPVSEPGDPTKVFEIEMYTDLHCNDVVTPAEEFNGLVKNQERVIPECGEIDGAANFCSDNQLRLLARVFGKVPRTARDFAFLLSQAIAPREFAIFVAKFHDINNDGEVRTRFITDRNLCAIFVESGEPEYDWLVIAAKLDAPPNSGGSGSGRSSPMQQMRKVRGTLPLPPPQAEVPTQGNPLQGPPIGEECRFEVETFGGFWSNIHIPEGALQAVIVGDARVGENACVDFVRNETIFQLSYFARNDMICDNPAPQVKNGMKKKQHKFTFVGSSDDLKQNQQSTCIFDTNAALCLNFELREGIHKLIDEYRQDDPYDLAKAVQAMLPDGGEGHTVMAVRLDRVNSYMVTQMSDPNLCWVHELTDEGINARDFMVFVSKLDFNPPPIAP